MRVPFKPHVTLMRKALVVRRERPLVAVAWRVDDFALVESKTTPDGAHYQVLTRWRLGVDSCGAQAGLRGSSPSLKPSKRTKPSAMW